MLMRYCSVLLVAVCVPCFFISCDKDDPEDPYRDVMVDFQEATFPDGAQYSNNAGEKEAFEFDIVSFPNHYEEQPTYTYWCGFAVSQMHDRTTPGINNQFSVFAEEDAGNKFAVVFVSEPGTYAVRTQMTFSRPVRDLSFDIANTTYAALVMKEGDLFGSLPFTMEDRFTLDIQLYDADNKPLLDEPEAVLMNLGTRIIDTWMTARFDGVAEISKVEFTMQSTEKDDWGMLTPAYFCLDNLKARTLK